MIKEHNSFIMIVSNLNKVIKTFGPRNKEEHNVN